MYKTLFQAAAIASLSQLTHAVGLNFVFGAGSYSTIAPPHGSGESGHTSGFSLVAEDGTSLYDNSGVNGYDPCFNTDPASAIKATSNCWPGTIIFNCKGDFSGRPNSCSADYNGIEYAGEVDKDTDFIGIAIATSGHCGGQVQNIDVAGCTADNANINFDYPTNR